MDSPSNCMQPVLNFRDKGFRENPHGVYTGLRRESSWAKVDGVEATLVLRHAQCETLLKDPRLGLVEYNSEAFATDHPLKSYFQMREGLMLFANTPRHEELRAPAKSSLSPRVIKRYEDMVRSLAQRAVADLSARLERGEVVDFVKEISIPFVSRVICEVVGMPDQDHALLARMTQEVADGLDPLGPRHSLAQAGDAYVEFQQYMSQELQKGRWKDMESFTNTFLGDIAACPHMLGGFRNHEDLISTTVMLLSAGHLTTNHSLSLSLESLLSDESHRGILADGTESITPLMVEEFFRFHSPAQITRRVVREQIEMEGGKVFHPGQAVWLGLASANRDERVFRNAQSLDFDRKPNPHLAFGGGQHYCLGMHLARLQLRVFLEELQSARLAMQIKSATPDHNIIFRGVKQLLLESM